MNWADVLFGFCVGGGVSAVLCLVELSRVRERYRIAADSAFETADDYRAMWRKAIDELRELRRKGAGE